MADVKIRIKTEKSGDAIKQTERDFSSLALGLNQGIELAGKVGRALKQAFDLAKEGAQVRQTGESFELLLDKVGAAPDLLNQLRRASRNTVDDMQLMSSTSTLLAGTQGDLATALANSTPQLLEIAKAAQKLNPSLGDTTFLYQSLATGIKRASPLILDNLGLTIKIGEANEKFAESLGKAAKDLTAEEQKMALLNATLDAGGVLIEQVGGNVDSATDDFARMEAQVTNLSNELKKSLAPAVADVAEKVADHLQVVNELNRAREQEILTNKQILDIQQALKHGYMTNADAIQAVADAEANAARETDYANSIAEEGKQKWSQYRKGIEDMTASLDRHDAAIRGVAVGYNEAFKAVDDLLLKIIELDKASVGQEAIRTLDQAFKDHLITEDEYISATVKVQNEMIGIGGAQIEASLAMRQLQADFLSGKLTASEYTQQVEALGNAVRNLPTKHEIEIVTRYRTEGSAPTVVTVTGEQKDVGAPGRQHGGAVMPGQAFMVGEHGPELFIPNTPGSIASNSTVNNMGGDTFNSITVVGSPGQSPDQIADMVLAKLNRASRNYGNSGAWAAGR